MAALTLFLISLESYEILWPCPRIDFSHALYSTLINGLLMGKTAWSPCKYLSRISNGNLLTGWLPIEQEWVIFFISSWANTFICFALNRKAWDLSLSVHQAVGIAKHPSRMNRRTNIPRLLVIKSVLHTPNDIKTKSEHRSSFPWVYWRFHCLELRMPSLPSRDCSPNSLQI